MKVFSVAEMIAAEKEADAAGHSYAAMMEAAGWGTAAAIQAQYEVESLRILVLVGPGNNGGDGLVAGRFLAEAGAKVVFYLFTERNPKTDSNFAAVQAAGLDVLTAAFDPRFRVLRLRLNGCDMVIDALLGTGVSRPISGELAKLMRQVQAGLEERADILRQQANTLTRSQTYLPPTPELTLTPTPIVVAVDCPSGLNCDTGTLDPLALTADLTVTFAGPKQGHFKFPGAAACGQLVVVDIGIDPQLPAVAGIKTEVATQTAMRAWLPARPADGHKGTFGRVLIAAGSAEYRGAPVLAGLGAFRAGAGLVAIATPEIVRASAVTSLPEATFPPLAAVETLAEKSADMLLPTLSRYRALLVGPGLGNAAPFLTRLLAGLASTEAPPVVIDADGLNLLAEREDWPLLLPPAAVITPHPGEMARLLDITTDELLARDRVEVAREQAATWGCVVLLKGAFTVVAHPEGQVLILPFANPILGTAGSGDVLSGVIATLLAQGLPPFESAVLAGYLHGLAGSLLAQEMGKGGALASEIATYVAYALDLLR